MKRRIVILMIMILFSCTLAGCNSKTKVKEHEDKDEIVEIKNEKNSNEEENNDDLMEIESIEVNELYDENIKDGGFVTYKKFITEHGKTYSIIKGYDKYDLLKWTYKTHIVDDFQFGIYALVGGYDDKIFLQEDDDIIVIDFETGKEKTRIEKFGRGITLVGIDNNTIYFAQTPFLGDHLDSKIIGYDKETLKKKIEMTVPEKYTEYIFDIEYKSGEIILRFVNAINDEVNEGDFSLVFNEANLKAFGFKIEKFN